MDIGQYGLVAAYPLDSLLIHWNLGDLGPLFAPLQHLWIPDCLTFFIFFSCDCCAFRALIIMSVAVFYMIMFCLFYLHCRDDINLDSSFLHFISLHLTLDTAFFSFCLL